MIDRWQQVKEILHEASELPEAQRGAFVLKASGGDAELIAEVESLLLSFDDASDFLEDPPVQLGGVGAALEGRNIGDYKIESLIAKGGMGSVYLARKEMDGVPMKVALKVIRFAASQAYLTRRFRMERQILARLTHENILRLLDGGVTPEGLPYIVTEYLDAQNLEQWIETQPTLSMRLKVFQGICDGVAYAHRNLVVHGDIKPSNILITRDGTPKLVDFGIARLLSEKEDGDPEGGQLTITMTPALTPSWASPEQLRGEPLTIESDCYELGRILFFLLTDRKPFDFAGLSSQQILEKLKREQPPKPSTITGDARLAGDLDNIALKSLEYELGHRYRSVDAFADDIERHLAMRPVLARRQTGSYRLQKFVQRNKVLVSTATAACIALLLAIGAALYQARQARLSYESSRQRFEQLRTLANSLIFETDEALVGLQGATKVRLRLVKSSLGYLDELSKQDTSDPQLKEDLAAAYEKIGEIQGGTGFLNFGQTNEALASFRKSEALRESIRKDAKKAPDFLAASNNLARIYARISATLRDTGDIEAGLSYERKALGIRQALFENAPGNLTFKRALASSLTTLSGSLSQMGDYSGVMETRREALKMHEEIVASNPKEASDLRGLALALARMASIEMHENLLKESLEHYKRAIDIDLGILARNPTHAPYLLSSGWSHNNYGVILVRLGRAAEALDHFTEARKLYESVSFADDRDVRSKSLLETCRIRTAQALLSLGRNHDALRFVQTALSGREKLAVLNPASAGVQGEFAEAHAALGTVYAALRQPAKARSEFHIAKQMLEKLVQSRRGNAAMKEDLQAIDKDLKALDASTRPGSSPRSSSK